MKKLLITIALICLIPLHSVKAQATYTSYWFPAYNNVTMESQLRVANLGSSSTTVTVKIANTIVGTHTLAAGALGKYAYTGQNDGPMRVQSDGQPIVASLRVVALPSNAPPYNIGMYEVMGQPIESTPTAMPTATPTATAPFNPSYPDCNGTGFPYYPMCVGSNNPVYWYTSVTATYNPIDMTLSNITMNVAGVELNQRFYEDTSCKSVFGNQKLFSIYNSLLSDTPMSFDTNNGPQIWLAEVHNNSGVSRQGQAIVPMEPIAGTIIDAQGQYFWNYTGSSKDCSTATILGTTNFNWISKVHTNGLTPYTVNGITYQNVAVITHLERHTLSGSDHDTVFFYGFRKDTGNVFTIYGNIYPGSNVINGQAWQAVN